MMITVTITTTMVTAASKMRADLEGMSVHGWSHDLELDVNTAHPFSHEVMTYLRWDHLRTQR